MFVWDVVNGLDYTGPYSGENARQCTAAGQTVAAGCVVGGVASCTTVCREPDVVLPDGVRYTIVKERLEWAAQFFKAALTVKPVLDPIIIDPSVAAIFGLARTSIPDADVVVIVTTRPSPFAAVAAYATCVQRDQHGRCTVGQLNWVPASLNPGRSGLPDAVSNERHTALHELVHVLGGMGPSPTFINESGLPQTNVYTSTPRFSDAYPKPATFISTPRVRWQCPPRVALRTVCCDDLTLSLS